MLGCVMLIFMFQGTSNFKHMSFLAIVAVFVPVIIADHFIVEESLNPQISPPLKESLS